RHLADRGSQIRGEGGDRFPPVESRSQLARERGHRGIAARDQEAIGLQPAPVTSSEVCNSDRANPAAARDRGDKGSVVHLAPERVIAHLCAGLLAKSETAV